MNSVIQLSYNMAIATRARCPRYYSLFIADGANRGRGFMSRHIKCAG